MAIKKRNEHLCDRYYYLGIDRDMKFSDVIGQLASEFYLTPNTVFQLIKDRDHALYLKRLREKKPDFSFFKEKYPWIVW